MKTAQTRKIVVAWRLELGA